jgi:hypothetical protein
LDAADLVAGRDDHVLVVTLADDGISVATAMPQEPTALARALLDSSDGGHVVWLVGDDGDLALIDALTPEIARRAEAGPQV